MTPAELLAHYDNGQPWSPSPAGAATPDVAQAYQQALAVRRRRLDRGELPQGFKIGFTNRGIWQRYNVFAPIWGTVWNTTLVFCEGEGEVALQHVCQPRIGPETVFGMRARPEPDATLDDLFDAIEWMAPGFEIVQSHLPDWKFAAPDAIRDGALHARLLVGRRIAVRDVAGDAQQLDAVLARTGVVLHRDGQEVERGVGANVLDSPLRALHHFLAELRRCPDAPDLLPADVVTTGTWTDAWPVAVGQSWRADFDQPLTPLQVRFR
ncbi:hydratase [Comamonadaceae bacterium G21597-S1]|nr:hydratase [Comamonadaceae bacterium G21597-S1]